MSSNHNTVDLDPSVYWNDDHNTYSTDIVELHGELSKFSRPLLTFAAVMTVIIMIVGVLGNLLTIVALLRCPKVRNVAAAFIISLCVADFIFCLFVLPFAISSYVSSTWSHGDTLCRVTPFMRYGNVGVSLLSIALITVNRYIMIAHHSMYARIYKKIWIALMIVFSWLFSYGMQVPTLLGVWGAFGYDSNLGACSITVDSNGRSSKTALFVIAFLVPCILIVVCYARIFWVVHSSEVRMRQHSKAEMPTATSTPVASPEKVSSASAVTLNNGSCKAKAKVKDQREQKARRNEWRITKMVLAIFLSFVICYLPITIVKIADKDVTLPGFHILGYILLYASACINPIIYVIMNKQYRQAYATVLMCRRPRMLSFTPGGSSAGEKSKEQHGYSYNHSRTQVSQVSLAESQAESSSPKVNRTQQLKNDLSQGPADRGPFDAEA